MIVISVSGDTRRPCSAITGAIASRNAGSPGMGAYWFKPARMWPATSSTRRGGGEKSGKPCDKLMASCSAASRDITVKMVVPTSGSLDG